MSRFLKSYRVSLQAIGPVFVGSGREISKKEYVQIAQDKVGLIDVEKFYTWMARQGKQKQLEDFLLGNSRDELTFWLRKQNIRTEEITPFIRYTLECGDTVREKGAGRMQVMECIKDAYGNPYIPGSSLKGMLRTILLAEAVSRRQGDYESNKKDAETALGKNCRRNDLMASEIKGMEQKTFCLLKRNPNKPQDAVNDILQGLIVSDSEPLSVQDLVLCQKVDVHKDRTEKNMPILRECLKPNTDIVFSITIDESTCGLTIQEIEAAIQLFYKMVGENFVSAFQGIKMPKDTCVFLGGGCGYVSKTITYPLYGKAKGLDITCRIFDKTRVPREHKHYKDREYGVSPHIIKCTKYHGELFQMGLCRYMGVVQY